MNNKISSREALVEKYQSSTEKEWLEFIHGLSIKGQFIDRPLYHLSFNENLDRKLIIPKPITGINGQNDKTSGKEITLWTELLPPRFCMSDTVLGCWKGLCPEIELTLEREKVGNSFKMILYKVNRFKNAKILTPEVLTNNYLVHDAHETCEYALIDGGVELIKNRIITFENTSYVTNKECYQYTPYNDKKYKTEMIGIPMKVLNEEYS